MDLLNDSLNVVLVGDWNKLFTTPDWVANKVFEKEELEIGVNGKGSDIKVSYRQEGVIIAPSQGSFVFSVANINNEMIDNLCKFLNNFLANVDTKFLAAIGINLDFIDDDCSIFTNMVDQMSDSISFANNGFEVVSTQIKRVLIYEEELINMDSSLDKKTLNIHFNKHNDSPKREIKFESDQIKKFIKLCQNILQSLGYEIEGEYK